MMISDLNRAHPASFWATVRRDAAIKWLNAEMIEQILLNFTRDGLKENDVPPVNPSNGQLFVFDKEKTKKFKHDGVLWTKKKGGARIQESYQNIKIKGEERLHGVYCKAEDNQYFQKRIYRFVGENSPLVLVHYRDCTPQNNHQSPREQMRGDHPTHNQGSSQFAVPEPYPMPSMGDAPMEPQFNNQYPPLPPPMVPRFQNGPKFGGSHQWDRDPVGGMNNDQFMPQFSHPFMHPGGSDMMVGQDQQMPEFSQQHLQLSMCIADFAPAVDRQGGNTKLLIVLSSPIPPQIMQRSMLQVMFGTVCCVPAEVVSVNVLRCRTPVQSMFPMQTHQPQQSWGYPLAITNQDGEVLTPPSEEFFSYSMPQKSEEFGGMNQGKTSPYLEPFPHSQLMQPPLSVNIKREPNGTGMEVQQGDGSQSRGSKLQRTRPRSFTSDDGYDFYEDNDSDDDAVPQGSQRSQIRSDPQEPERKIRVVEVNRSGQASDRRESSGRSRIDQLQSEISGLKMPTNIPSSVSMEWLDDLDMGDISDLSQKDIDSLMDKYLTSVVTQLVDLASGDADLQQELDTLDSNGFSFLHYCSLYNLTALIPELLSKNVDVNQASACGSTPMHLAVSAGHLPSVKLLVEAGANLAERDANGYMALDIARMRKNVGIIQYLVSTGKAPEAMDMPPPHASDDKDTHEGMRSGSKAAATASSGNAMMNHQSPRRNVHKHADEDKEDRVEGEENDKLTALPDRKSFAASTKLTSHGGGLPVNYLISGLRHLEEAQRSKNNSSEQKEGTSESADTQTPLSSKLLYDAFTSLSLADKCALAICISNQHEESKRRKHTTDEGSPNEGAAGRHTTPRNDGESSLEAEHRSMSMNVSSHDSPHITSSGGQHTSSTGQLSVGKGVRADATSFGASHDRNRTHIFSRPLDSSPSGSIHSVHSGHSGIHSGNDIREELRQDLGLSRSVHDDDGSVGNSVGDNSSAGNPDCMSASLTRNSSRTSLTGPIYPDREDTGDYEIESVLSESERESLDVVLRMMGDLELNNLSNEVKKIQTNVRAWILRKNFINLRSAAKTLQVAWRERRNSSDGTSDGNMSSGDGLQDGSRKRLGYHSMSLQINPVDLDADEAAAFIETMETPSMSLSASTFDFDASSVGKSGVGGNTSISDFQGRVTAMLAARGAGMNTNESSAQTNTDANMTNPTDEIAAASTLQAATRGMLARRNFTSIRKQAMASLVIQKSLRNWWTLKSNVRSEINLPMAASTSSPVMRPAPLDPRAPRGS